MTHKTDILYPLRRLHGQMHDAGERYKLRRTYIKEFKKNPNTVFLILTPEHGNLGDHAIAQAETELLTRLGINYIEITGQRLDKMKWANQLDILNGFPVLFQGGGYLGTLWPKSEELLRCVILKNPKSKFTFFPNTIFYEPSEWGQGELCKSVELYNRHKHLTLYAREQISYDFMKPIYRDVRLVPDMVLSLKKDNYNIDRKGCLLCLRGDCEKTRTLAQDEIIRQQAEKLFGTQVSDTDMVISGRVPVEKRENALNEKFKQFASAELVITDRLHGMIFCAITGTPCIVLDSKSPKVRGCYEWIKHLDYIRFADKPEDIVDEYQKIPEGPHHYDNSHLTHYYESLAQDINNIWR